MYDGSMVVVEAGMLVGRVVDDGRAEQAGGRPPNGCSDSISHLK